MQLQIRYLRTLGRGRPRPCLPFLANPPALESHRSRSGPLEGYSEHSPRLVESCGRLPTFQTMVGACRTDAAIDHVEFYLAYQQFFRVNNAAWCRTKDNCGTIDHRRAQIQLIADASRARLSPLFVSCFLLRSCAAGARARYRLCRIRQVLKYQ